MDSDKLKDWRLGVLVSVAATALVTLALTSVGSGLSLLNAGLILLLLTLAVSAFWGVKVGVFAAGLSNLALNYYFVPPLHGFSVYDSANVVALASFLIVSVVAGSLVSATRVSAERARLRQSESEALLQLSRALIIRTEPRAALDSLCQHVVDTLRPSGAAVLSQASGAWSVLSHAGATEASRLPDGEERSLASRVLASGQADGLGYSGLGQGRRPRIVLPALRRGHETRAASVTLIPLRIGDRQLGLLRLDGPLAESPFRKEPQRLLAAFAQEAALAVQRFELAQAASEAEAWRQADALKSALMASISHDLKTPLATIKASVSGLLGGNVVWSEEDRRSFLEAIESQTDRLDRVISDILDLNRLQSGVLVSHSRPVFASDLLEEAREAVARALPQRQIVIESDGELVVQADRALLRQALVNLIENAVAYSPAESAVRLQSWADGESVCLAVADQGPGIDAEDQAHIFESFYRGRQQGQSPQGTGLGLAIVKGFVELSGGRVRLESSAQGSRFVISLPMAVAPVPVQA